MAGLLHLGVGFAYKRFRPEYHVIVLILLAYFLDILFMIFWIFGLEHLSGEENSVNPWSHSVVMGILWSVVVGSLLYWKTGNQKVSLSMGLLVISHLIIDIISHPMTAVFPNDSPLPLFFTDSQKVGLGLWSSDISIILGEYVLTFILFLVYLLPIVHKLVYQSDSKTNKEIST